MVAQLKIAGSQILPRQSGHAQLTNMRLALQTLMDCTEAGEELPRLGLFYGFSGYGKSVSAAFAAAKTDAVYVEARSVWTQRTLLENIAKAVGITKIGRSGPIILDQVTEQLAADPRPLIIDEMDYLVKKQSVEIIRDIHDTTKIAILMIGEESLPAKLKEWERFDNRILVATAAQPASEDDALKLRDHYCLRVAIADDLALMFQDKCRGVTRRIIVNLQNAQRVALQEGHEALDLASWGNRPIMNGDHKVRRQTR